MTFSEEQKQAIKKANDEILSKVGLEIDNNGVVIPKPPKP